MAAVRVGFMAAGVSYFPKDYRGARDNFRAACDGRGLGVTSRVHPSAKGPRGRPLFMDTACSGPKHAKRALLLISGTHDVEGYFGSGVQTGLLREGLAARVPEGVRVMLLHALNPYGFAWNRRVNEDNADINRNFVDFRKPPKNMAYDKLAAAIAPPDMSKAGARKANAILRAYAGTHGAFALQTAISAGQYRHADGLYYGGARESWSAAMLRAALDEHLPNVKKLIVIDYHTGLGGPGTAEMVTEDMPGSAAYRRQKAIWGPRLRSSESGESLSAPLSGTIDEAMAAWLPKTQLTFAALEVGTVPMRDVFQALRRDNWLHLHSRPGAKAWAEGNAAIRAAFYPDTPSWKRKAWRHARETFEQALAVL